MHSAFCSGFEPYVLGMVVVLLIVVTCECSFLPWPPQMPSREYIGGFVDISQYSIGAKHCISITFRRGSSRVESGEP
jgi:hypothetical protein